jgi:hypothetical protein
MSKNKKIKVVKKPEKPVKNESVDKKTETPADEPSADEPSVDDDEKTSKSNIITSKFVRKRLNLD